MLKTYGVKENGLVETAGDDAAVWLFITPDDTEKRMLVDQFRVDEHTLNSALDPDELARLEFETDHAAMILKVPRSYSAQDKFLFKVSSLGMFLFKQRLVIVLSEELPLLTGRPFVRVSSVTEVALRVINRVIQHYMEHLRVIVMMTDALEQKINKAMENRYLISLFSLEKSLVFYLSAIASNGMLLEKLRINAVKLGLTADHIELLDDVFIENNQCNKQAEINSNILASMMDARASIVSNNLNVLMKNLNVITIGFMVPTLVVSAFSMNVRQPFDSERTHTFWFIMALAVICELVFVLLWRRSQGARWFRHSP